MRPPLTTLEGGGEGGGFTYNRGFKWSMKKRKRRFDSIHPIYERTLEIVPSSSSTLPKPNESTLESGVEELHAIRKRKREEGPSFEFEPAPKRQRTEEVEANEVLTESGDVPLVQEEPTIVEHSPPIHLPENSQDYQDLSDIVQLDSPDPHFDMEEEEALYAELCNEIEDIVLGYCCFLRLRRRGKR